MLQLLCKGEEPLGAPLLDGTGRRRRRIAPFTFSSIGIDDVELGPSVGVVLGVLFAASRLKMTRSKSRFALKIDSGNWFGRP